MPLPRRPDFPDAPGLCFLPCTNGGAAERIQSMPTQSPGRYPADLEPLRAELAEMKRQITELVSGQAEMLMTIGRVHDDVSAAFGNNGATQGAQELEKITLNGNESNIPVRPAQAVTMDPVKEVKVDVLQDKQQVMMPNQPSEGGPTRELSSKSLAKEAEDLQAVSGIITLAEEKEIQLQRVRTFKEEHGLTGYWKDQYNTASRGQIDMSIDSVMGVIISFNALTIGLAMDLADAQKMDEWFVIDLCFSIIFLCEIAVKIKMHGFCGHFCGPQSKSNIFDASLIAIDSLQTSLVVFAPDLKDQMGNTPSASLFRMVRLIKLTRLLRLLRSEVFKDLMSMVQGLLGGMQTLVWAMVLFFIIVYVMALVFRELLGRDEKDHIYELFHNVPRAMFTTFRCSFGDCSTIGGAPLFEQVQLDYGGWFSAFYCIFIFSMTVGLFNVISAIFVESTMAAAMSLQQDKKAKRLQDETLWSTNMNALIQRIMDVSPDYSIPGKMSDFIAEVAKVTVGRKVIDEVVTEKIAIDALNALDIDPEDHRYLSDILDPDNSGTIPIADFVDGIRRLRGEPRRSDIVSVDLMIRAIQGVLQNLTEKIDSMHDTMVPVM